MAQSQVLSEYIGERFEDAMKGSQRAVRQANRAFKKGTSFRFRVGLQGTLDAEIVEDSSTESGVNVKILPGVATAASVDGEAGGGWGRGRTMDVGAAGALSWSIDIEVLNAVAIEDDEGAGS